MVVVVLAVLAGLGVYLIFSAYAFGRRSLVVASPARSLTSQVDDLARLAGVNPANRFRVTMTALALLLGGALGAWLVFGGVIAPVFIGTFAASFPFASARQSSVRARAEAAEGWPRMIEELRLLTGSLGRPIPQALLEVGRGAPSAMRPAFDEAERVWRISTDFERTVAVLKERLDDPTADAACETLLVAHKLGGSDIERRLAALAEDRHLDLQGRKDAKAKQAGVRFARRFVLLVPAGMALAGMSIGTGREAYATLDGQLGIGLALAVLAGCWWWSGRLIRLPREERVFRA